MRHILFIIVLTVLISGCSNMQIKNGELYFNDKTSATIEDVGVAKVTNRF